MISNSVKLSKFLKGSSVLFICLSAGIFLKSCGPIAPTPEYKVYKNWLDWNILMKGHTSPSDKENAIDSLSAAIREETDIKSVVYYLRQYFGSNVQFRLDTFKRTSCICDPLLDNLTADLLIDTAGGSVTTPPPAKDPPIVPSGSTIAYLDDNDAIDDPASSLTISNTDIIKISGTSSQEGKILAVIDTGIDTTLFSNGIQKILWGSPTDIYNFLIGAPDIHDFSDKSDVRHGTSVTAIALNAFGKNPLPKIMVLKALGNNEGSVFTVSCAMNYAINNRAMLINMSLGYYGKPDKVLAYYLSKAGRSEILVVAAAGNDAGPDRNGDIVCQDQLRFENMLTTSHRFYPACWSNEYGNLISVTGLSNLNMPCFYQNFSQDYVTLGIMNTNNPATASGNIEKRCCSYRPSFLNGFIEGSSFATPVVSGKVGSFIIINGKKPTIDAYISGIGAQKIPGTMSPAVTWKGHYIAD